MSDETLRVMSDAEMDEVERLAERRLKEARTRTSDPELTARVEANLRLPYRPQVRGDPAHGYLAAAPELPGCITDGETPEAAVTALRDAMASWIETAIADGAPVPEPSDTPLFATGLDRKRVQFIADIEKGLETTGVAAGPILELKRTLRALIVAIARDEKWDPATDTLAPTMMELFNSYLRFLWSLSPELRAELLRRLTPLLDSGTTSPTDKNKSSGR